MAIFEFVFIAYLGLAPSFYSIPQMADALVHQWQWRLVMCCLAILTPCWNLVGFRYRLMRQYQDTIMVLGGLWLVAIQCYVFLCFPQGMAKAMFGCQLIIVISIYNTPSTRYSHTRVLALMATAAFAATDVYLGEFPSAAGKYYIMIFLFVLANTVGILVGRERDRMMRQLFINTLEIDIERKQSARLVANILPASIAKQLSNDGDHQVAATIADASILFADIVGFTPLSRTVPARLLIDHLSYLFSRFDALTEEFQIEKIKTIGDAYMAAGGVPDYRHDHLRDLARMAFKMQDEMIAFGRERGLHLQLRIGIHTGSVIAGVLGTKKFSYDLWGDTVNFASRLEASALPGTIQVSEAAAQILRSDFEIHERGTVDLKGLGETRVFVLTAPLKITKEIAA